jgi:hypothetical protein
MTRLSLLSLLLLAIVALTMAKKAAPCHIVAGSVVTLGNYMPVTLLSSSYSETVGCN